MIHSRGQGGFLGVDANQRRDLLLIEKIRAHHPGAREELVRKYIPLVKHIVRRYYVKRMDADDLLQEGLIGLLAAIDEYRPDRFPVRFSSFAYLCVVRKMYNVIKQANGPRHRAHHEAVSLQAFLSQDDSRTLLELCADDRQVDPVDIVEDRLVARELDRLLARHLSRLEYSVLGWLLQGFTCTDIGLRLGIPPKAVDNARTRIKLKLRRLLDRYGSLLDPRAFAAGHRRTISGM